MLQKWIKTSREPYTAYSDSYNQAQWNIYTGLCWKETLSEIANTEKSGGSPLTREHGLTS